MESIKSHFENKTYDLLEYYSFIALEFKGAVNGFFTRRGGVSAAPMESLNLGGGLGDTRGNIIENKRRILSALKRSEKSVFDVWQIHSANTVFADRPRNVEDDYQQADAIFTENPAVTLLMRFADCVPILLFHPGEKKIVGIVHAGWKGTLNRICEKSVEQACKHYATEPNEWVAGIGPSIGPDHFEVGREIKEIGEKVFSQNNDDIFKLREGKIYMNLWEANRSLLRKAGVKTIYSMEICTACDTGSWFSHRAENGKTGRFAGLIGLE